MPIEQSDLWGGATPGERYMGRWSRKVAALGPQNRTTNVARLTAQGISNKEIAARLEVNVKTVETYYARA